MRAVWYECQGPAGDVLQIGELPDPEPGPGEVRVRVRFSGVNPGDTKKRRGWLGSTMAFPRVIPHSDGSGVVDKVGDGVDPMRMGRRVWVYGAQSYRSSGTAAQYTVVPDRQAVELPDEVDDLIGACLGIPGITAHRAGAHVIVTVRRAEDADRMSGPAFKRVVALDERNPVGAVHVHVPDGVDRIIEVAFAENIDFDAAVAKNGTVIAAYATGRDRPDFPFWPMLFDNITIRLLGSDDFPPAAKHQAARDLTAAAAGDLVIPFNPPMPLEQTAAAHTRVDESNHHRTILAVPN